MFTRSSIYALAAVAAVTALATSSASAGHGPMGMKVPAHGPMGVSIKPHGPQGIVIKPQGPQGIVIKPQGPQGVVIKPKPIVGIIINPKPHWPPLGNWCKWHYCGPHWTPVVTGGVGIVGATAVATAPAQACTCLTKTYLADGSVQFKDICTTETAIATPDQRAQAPGVAPQAQ
jgi:hypothetical protein